MTTAPGRLTEAELDFTLDTLEEFGQRVERLRSRAANPVDLKNAEDSLAVLAQARDKLQRGEQTFSHEEAKTISCAVTNRRRFINAMLDAEVLDEEKRDSLRQSLRVSNSAIRTLNAMFDGLSV